MLRLPPFAHNVVARKRNFLNAPVPAPGSKNSYRERRGPWRARDPFFLYSSYFCCCLAFSSLGGIYQQCLHLLLRASDECLLLLAGTIVGASAASAPSRRCVKSLRSSEVKHLP